MQDTLGRPPFLSGSDSGSSVLQQPGPRCPLKVVVWHRAGTLNTGPRNPRNVQLSGNNGGKGAGKQMLHSSQPPEIQRDPLKGWAKCPQHSSEKMLAVQIPNTGNCPGQNSECDTELGFWGHFPKGWHCLSSLLCLVSSSYCPWAVIKNLCLSRVWKMPAILTLGRQRQEDGEFEDSLKGPWL